MAKKYYWLKLREDFFRQIAIKKLRKIAGGDTYTIIYLKLQLLSLKNEGKIYFEGIEENIADELALELDEDTENVKMTLLFLENHNLLEVSSSGGENEYTLPAVLACIGRESESAERMRRLRARQKQQQLPGGTNEEKIKCDVASQCDADVRKSDTDIDIDIDKEQQREHDGVDAVEIFSKYRIDIRPVLKQNPDAFLCLGEEELEKIASTLKEKYNEGIITNPVGLLLHDLTGITKAILCGTFYPKKKKKSQNDYELYF